MKTLVIDTNQITKTDWRLNGSLWRLLRGLARTRQIRLVVPEVVVAEAVGVFRRTLVEVNQDLRKLEMPLDADQATASYESDLRLALDSCNAEVPPDDHITVPDLVERATARTRPFDKDGNGFRDTVVWTRVLQIASLGEDVVLITNDNDFCHKPEDKRELHPSLVNEVGDLGSVGWFSDILSYVESSGRNPELSEIDQSISAAIARDQNRIDLELAEAITQGAVKVHGRDSVFVRVTKVLDLIKIGELFVAELPDQPGLFAVVLPIEANLIIDVVTQADESTTQRQDGVKILTDKISVEAIFDSSMDSLHQFSGGVVELNWPEIAVGNTYRMGVRREASSEGSQRLPASEAEAVRRVLENFQTVQAGAAKKILEGIELSSIQKLVETFQRVQAGAAARILEGSDFSSVSMAVEAMRHSQEGAGDAQRLDSSVEQGDQSYDEYEDGDEILEEDEAEEHEGGREAPIGPSYD